MISQLKCHQMNGFWLDVILQIALHLPVTIPDIYKTFLIMYNDYLHMESHSLLLLSYLISI